ncbi:MAG TPA: MobF family relaxase [Acidimicrobiales bacterium]|nr:MobF family relaxase [Acidimicrobiales bacterium]
MSIGKLTMGQQKYYVDQVAQGIEDYYAGAGEAPGRWLASSHQLGLDGDVDPAQLRAVLQGHDPTDAYKLVNTSNRKIAGFDLTFSAPKSVSVLWALGDPGVNLAVADAHQRAVDAALDYIERNAAFTRRGHGGAEVIESKGLLAAGFRHRTSRNGDPQLHTHVLVPNMVEGIDGRWGTLDGRHLYRHARTAGYLYQSELRHQLTAVLGVGWTSVQRGSAEVEGIPTAVLSMFSTRRVEIEERLEILGQTSPAAARQAVLDTRGAKLDLDSTSLFARWGEQAREVGFDPAQLDSIVGRAAPLEFGLHHVQVVHDQLASPVGLTEHASTFDRRDVVRAISQYAPTGATAQHIEAHADAFLHGRHDVVALTTTDSTERYSTRELLDIETRLVTTAVARSNEGAGAVPSSTMRSVLALYPTIAGEQARLVATLTTSGNGVDVVVAAAGTGKTYALGCAREVWRRGGYRVHGAALAGRAAQELETNTRIPSQTIAKLVGELQRRPLTASDVIVVDEAGMAGTRRLAPILDAAAAVGAKVVLVGDYHQLPEIEAGGLLRGLAARIAPVELIENRRQHEPWERHALIELRHGNVQQALTAYAEHGHIHSAPDRDTAKRQLVDAWHTATRNGDHAIMIAPRRSDVDQLNALARQQLTDDRTLRGVVLTVDGTSFQRGDRVVTLRNDYHLGVRNGTLATITKIHGRSGEITIRPDHGKPRRISDAYLHDGHLVHGYAITIHKAQGITTDRAYILGTGDLYRELGYVALSRGRLSNDLYLTEPTRREHAHHLEIPTADRATGLQTSRQQTLGIDR